MIPLFRLLATGYPDRLTTGAGQRPPGDAGAGAETDTVSPLPMRGGGDAAAPVPAQEF